MCGIFGQINFKRSTFNKTIFNTLGIANDTRGGDSCGIFVDKQVEYGVNNKKLYQNFFLDSEILKCEKSKKGWIAATVIGSAGVVATGVAAGVQGAQIADKKQELAGHNQEIENKQKQLKELQK